MDSGLTSIHDEPAAFEQKEQRARRRVEFVDEFYLAAVGKAQVACEFSCHEFFYCTAGGYTAEILRRRAAI